jgi:hypothetical protein
VPGTPKGETVKLSHSAYPNPQKMAEFADTLLSRTSFTKDGSGKPVFSLFHDLVTYSNRPRDNQGILGKVAHQEGGGYASALLIAFAGNHDQQEYMDLVNNRVVDGQTIKSRLMENYNKLEQSDPEAFARYGGGAGKGGPGSAVVNLAQIPGRLELLSREFGEHAHPHPTDSTIARMKQLGQEIVTSTKTQMAKLELDIEMLSDPRLLKGLSEEQVTLVNDLRTQSQTILEEMRNPSGPYQQFIALGALAASDPETAITRIKDLLWQMPGYVPPPPKDPPPPLPQHI